MKCLIRDRFVAALLAALVSSCVPPKVGPVVKSIRLEQNARGYGLAVEKCALQRSGGTLKVVDCRSEWLPVQVPVPTCAATDPTRGNEGGGCYPNGTCNLQLQCRDTICSPKKADPEKAGIVAPFAN